jgi:hypothetical protein
MALSRSPSPESQSILSEWGAFVAGSSSQTRQEDVAESLAAALDGEDVLGLDVPLQLASLSSSSRPLADGEPPAMSAAASSVEATSTSLVPIAKDVDSSIRWYSDISIETMNAKMKELAIFLGPMKILSLCTGLGTEIFALHEASR